MKITDLQVDGFGVWKGLTIESLSDDITVFCGQNEAGKTTLMQFIRSMLFGFSATRREKYVPPVYGGLAGGSMDVGAPTGLFEVQRHVDPNRLTDPIGDLAVTDQNSGNVHGAAQLGNLMSEMDESIFNNVFAIGLREIQELGALNSTDAAEHLYKLTSGMDRVSLIDVMKDLKKRRGKIWNVQPKTESRLETLFERQTKLLREIDELKTKAKRWTRITARTTDITNQLQDIAQQIEELERESRLVEIAMQISERWQRRRLLSDQIRSFGDLPDQRDVSISQLEKLNAKIVQQKERIDQIKQQRSRIKKDALGLPINRTLWAQKSKVEAIMEHAPWVESLQRQTERLHNEVESIQSSMTGEFSGLGNNLQIRSEIVKELGRRGLSSVKTVAKKVIDQRNRLKRLQEEHDKSEFELTQHQERLGNSLSERGTTDSLEDTSRYVSRLRRRIELEDKINKLTRSRHDLERDIDDVVNEQVLPVGKLSVIGVVFILGVVMLGFGLLDAIAQGSSIGRSATQMGFLMMLLGTFFGFVSMALKYHWERMAKDELDDFRHQMDIIRTQLKRAKQERDDIERQLPAEILGQWELELQEAESRLARMEGLVPLENRVNNSRMGMDELRRRIQTQKREVELIEKEWRASLRAAGLPEELEPLQLKEVSLRSSRIAGYHDRLEQFQRELEERDKELNSVNNRVTQMLNDAGIKYDGNSLSDRLGQLTASLGKQRSLVNTRKELAGKYRSLRSRLSKSKRELDKLLGQKRRLLAKVGADTEVMFREFDQRYHQRDKLMTERTALGEQIKAALGSQFAEADMRTYLDSYGQSGLEKRWEAIVSEVDLAKQQQNKLLQQRGEYLQEVKMLGEDSRLDEARLELNAIETEIGQLKKQWQVYASSTQMLESIRESYESKRQPETLREASGYLQRLSEGRYTRIWTRLVGEELLVDNDNDETITVDKLSRGTREAVYLSLRLALIGVYARRGILVPMVLDDVLVNFDGQRARAAAELLCDFSRNGYQILMFTCHDHIRNLFHELNADVRVLPNHRDVFESQATPTRYGSRQIVKPAAPIVHSRFETSTVQSEPRPIPVEIIPAQPKNAFVPKTEYVPAAGFVLETDEYDPELEYELSAVIDDQQTQDRLRHGLVYISQHYDSPIDLSGDEDIWLESSRVLPQL